MSKEYNMASVPSDVQLTERHKHPYWRFLKTKHRVSIDKLEKTAASQELETLIDSDNKAGYREALAKYKGDNKKFLFAEDGSVREIVGIEKEVDMQVAVQVKGHSITWYFFTDFENQDRYPQTFRDVLYDSAAIAHQKVTRGCDLYYRGSNAFHVKTMHTKEQEAHWNHNHYRMSDNQPVRAVDFEQHMLGFKGTKAETGLAGSETPTGYGKFFTDGEIEEIIEDFKQWELGWTYQPDGSGSSFEEQYMALPENKLNRSDVIEFFLFGAHQEPCRISASELTQDYEAARKAISAQVVREEVDNPTAEQQQAMKLEQAAIEAKLREVDKEYQDVLAFRKIGGSRGLASELAWVRQLPNSDMKTFANVWDKDDALCNQVPRIPEWAKSARANMERTRKIVFESADMEHLGTGVGDSEEHFAKLSNNLGVASKLGQFGTFGGAAAKRQSSAVAADVKAATVDEREAADEHEAADVEEEHASSNSNPAKGSSG